MSNSLAVTLKYELNAARDNIVALQDDVIPDTVTFKLYAWPFSRNLIKAICIDKAYTDLTITRLNKDLEEYTVTGDLNLEAKIKQIIKIINRLSKETKPDDLSVYRHRNFVTADVLVELFDFITCQQHTLQCQGKDIFTEDDALEVIEDDAPEVIEDDTPEVIEDDVPETEPGIAVDYTSMLASDLRAIAQERKLPGAWKAKRESLAAMLIADDTSKAL